MVEKILAPIAAAIIAVISAGGYGGIALLMAIESACIPLPSEVIMPFAGYLVSVGRFSLFWAACAGALGCNIGSALAYWVGAVGGRPAVERFGRYILLDLDELDAVERYFTRYGSITVFVCRLLPVVRTFIALPAGIARMNQVKFHLYTFVGSFPWCYALAYAGMKLGEAWSSDPTLRTTLHRFDAVILLVLVAAAAWYVWHHLTRRNRRRS